MFAPEEIIEPTKVAAYIRWSTDEQGQGTTLEVQKEACQKFIESQGWEFREDLLFVDDGYSGGNLNRPGMSQLREAVRAGRVQCVVVYKLDRLSRSVIDTVNLVLHEWEGRCYIRSTREPIDTTSPMGKQFFYMLVSYAEWERSVIRERTMSGKRKRAEQGRNAGQKYPYGYQKGRDGHWALDGWDPEQNCFTGPAAVVRRIFDEYRSGLSATTIATRLRNEAIPTPEGGAWRPGAVMRILQNPIYAGTYVYGMRRGKGRKRGAPGYQVDRAAPAIVSPEEFEQVQKRRQERAELSPRSLASGYLLSGLVRCTKCGHPVNGSKNTANDKRYYVCTNRTLLKGCDCAYIDAMKLERAFLQKVKETITVGNLRYHIEQMESEIRQTIAERSFALQAAEAEIARLERKLRKVEDDYANGDIDGRAYSKVSQRWEAELAEAKERLDQARRALDEAQAATVDPDQLLERARRLDAWEELSVDELKQICRDVTASLAVYQAKSPPSSKRGNPNPLYIEWRPKLDVTFYQRDDVPLGHVLRPAFPGRPRPRLRSPSG